MRHFISTFRVDISTSRHCSSSPATVQVTLVESCPASRIGATHPSDAATSTAFFIHITVCSWGVLTPLRSLSESGKGSQLFVNIIWSLFHCLFCAKHCHGCPDGCDRSLVSFPAFLALSSLPHSGGSGGALGDSSSPKGASLALVSIL